MMAYLTLMILLLTVSQSLNSQSIEKTEEPVELSWLETILLFPCGITDCEGLERVPVDDMDETEMSATNANTPENTIELAFLEKTEEDIVSTLEVPEVAEEKPVEMTDSKDDDENLVTHLIDSVKELIKRGQEIACEVFGIVCDATDTVWQQCVAGACNIWELCPSSADWLPEIITGNWASLQQTVCDEVIAATEAVFEVFKKIPCEWALADHTMWWHLRETFDTFVGEINWYIFTSLVTLAAALSIHLVRKNRGQQKKKDQSTHTNQFSSIYKTNNELPMKLCEAAVAHAIVDQNFVAHKPALGSPVKQSEVFQASKGKGKAGSPGSPGKKSAVHKTTKASLEVKNNNEQPSLPAVTSSPRPELVDVGIESVLLNPNLSSDINEATDTDDLTSCRETSTSPKPLGSSSMPSPLWIRYGSSPSRNKPADDSKMTSPIWIRRISNEKEGVTSFIQKQATPVRPSNAPKRRYVPSPIVYTEDHFSRSFDVDIGDPCCSSSFIEECLSESEEKVRRDSGDSLRHSQSFRPSVITKRYTKLKGDEFSMSRNSSTDSMLMNVSDMNKSISLYNGDSETVFFELAFFYAIQNVFNRLRELISWSRWARTRHQFR